jgi:hypothetical protein
MVFIITCSAQAAGTGGGAAAFLRAGAGARALSLSGAFSASYDDASCGYWNPAAVAFTGRPGISTMYSLLSDERAYNYAAIVYPTPAGAFGFSFLNFSIGGIEGRTSDTEGYTEIKDTENAYSITYAYPITRWFSAGANFKVLQITLGDYSAGGISFDAGVILKASEIVSVGVSLRDAAGFLKWNTGYKEDIPILMRIGTQVKLFDNILNLSVDAEKNEFEGLAVMSGAEVSLFKMFFLRAGLSYGMDSYEFDYTAGMGARVPVSTFLIQADYAFQKEEYFTSFQAQHRFSLSVYF